MSLPTLSVVLPNYNHAKYLPVALEAICAQSAPPLEVLAIDDGSTDGSLEILQAFARRYPFLRVVPRPHQGFAATINHGIELARGEYLIAPAADDKILPGLFEKSLSLLAAHPRAVVCSALAVMLGPEGEELGAYDSPVVLPEPGFIPPERVFETYARHGSWIVTHSAVYRRSALLEAGGWDAELGHGGDGVFNYCLPAKYGACFIPRRLASWRKLDTSMSMGRREDVQRTAELLERLERKFRSPQWAPYFGEAFIRLWKRRAIAGALYETARSEPEAAEKLAWLVSRMPERSWSDALYLSALRLAPLARAATKLYLYWQQPGADKRRIAAGRLRRLMGARA